MENEKHIVHKNFPCFTSKNIFTELLPHDLNNRDPRFVLYNSHLQPKNDTSIDLCWTVIRTTYKKDTIERDRGIKYHEGSTKLDINCFDSKETCSQIDFF